MTSPAGTLDRQGAARGTGLEVARNPRLDGLRGVAILPVMLYHLTFFGMASGPAEQAFTFLPSIGYTSVDLFFVLSGYLITDILWRAKGAHHYFRPFYARRALRIFPLYYAVLLFFFVVAPRLAFLGDPGAFWVAGASRETLWFWLYLENLYVAFTGQFHHHFLGITWTLCIEEQFYLAWPLVVLLSGRRRLLQICVGLVGSALLLRGVLALLGASPVALLTFTFCRIDTLAAGSLLALLSQDPSWRARLVRIARPALPVAATLWLGVVLLARHSAAVGAAPVTGLSADERALQVLAFTANPWVQTLGFSFDLAFYAALLVTTLAAPASSLLARVAESGFLRRFGRYSYAMYLLHLFVAEFARAFYDPNRTDLPFVVEQLLWWAVSLSAIYLVAYASFTLFESHFLKLKRWFPMEHRIPAGVAPPLPARTGLE